MKLRIVGAVTALSLFAGIISGCGGESSAVVGGDRPRVVASAYPLYEAAARIGGKNVHAMNLLPTDPYGVVPARKAESLRSSDLAVVLAEGVQPEVDKIVAERSKPTVRISAASVSGGADHNAWLDPQVMSRIAETVHDSLRLVAPDADSKFTKNFKRYKRDIAHVDRSYAQAIATCKRTEVLVEDPQFGFLADRFELRQIPVGKLTTDKVNEQAKATVERTGATTVFASTLPSLDQARRIRSIYGVKVAVLDPAIAQTDQSRRGGSSYSVFMEINLDALRVALDCEPKTH